MFTDVVIDYDDAYTKKNIVIKESPFFKTEAWKNIDHDVTLKYLQDHPQAVIVGAVMKRLPKSDLVQPVVNFKTYVGFDREDYSDTKLFTRNKLQDIVFTFTGCAKLSIDKSSEQPAQIRPLKSSKVNKEEPMQLEEEKYPTKVNTYGANTISRKNEKSFNL